MKCATGRVAIRGLFCFLASLLSSLPASAAEPAPSRSQRESVTIATSLVTPFFGAYYLEGKIRTTSTIALVFNASYLVLDNDDGWKTKSGTAGAGVEYFFQGGALQGFYLEAIAELWLSWQRHEPSGEVAPLELGYAGIALTGYQFVWDAGPVLDLGAGVVAFHLPSARVVVDGVPVTSDALTKVYPAAKVNVGWAF